MSDVEKNIMLVNSAENSTGRNDGNSNIQGVILLQNEPLTSILGKWLSWMALMVVFVLFLIYYSNYFAKSSECVIGDKSFNIPHNE